MNIDAEDTRSSHYLTTSGFSGERRALSEARAPGTLRNVVPHCLAFATKVGCSCSARDCKWVQTFDPIKVAAARTVSGGVGGGGHDRGRRGAGAETGDRAVDRVCDTSGDGGSGNSGGGDSGSGGARKRK